MMSKSTEGSNQIDQSFTYIFFGKSPSVGSFCVRHHYIKKLI